MNESSAPKTRLQVRVAIEAIDWNSVDAPQKLRREFLRKLRSPVNPVWLRRDYLTEDEQKVVRALCERFGAYVLTIEHARAYYEAAFEFNPFAETATARKGQVKARYALLLFGRRIPIRTMLQAVLFYLMLVLSGTVLYAIGAGLLLYAFAVFLLFLADPAMTTIVATRKASIGLALLCFLVALAGFSGKAVRNVAGLACSAWRRWRGRSGS